MKKDGLPLEEKIVETALKMFNENGIEYVGMREIATTLGIRIGNLNYYFATKDDLVNRLSLGLAEENSKTIIVHEQISMSLFFETLRQVFRNHLKYRCLMLSFVHLIQRNALIAKRYSKAQAYRNQVWETNIKGLINSKYLVADTTEVAFLVSTIALIARFWISESVISFKTESDEAQMRHYLKMIARIFLPYSTAKGKAYLNEILDE
jgi:AcrR family transcriptional regulator